MRCHLRHHLHRLARHGRGRRHGSGEAGFSLIEILATSLIVMLIAAGVAQGLIAGAHLSGYQRTHTQADEVAQQDQERLRGLSAKQLSALATPQTYTSTLDGTVYTVTSSASLLSSSGSSSCTSTGTGAIAYYHTTSTVTWSDSNQSQQSVKEESVIAPPAGGTLLAQVNDQTGAGLPGVTITATGPDTESATTDTSGCIYMAGLTAGSYTLGYTDTGYVDPNGNTSISSSATVSSTGTALPASNPVTMGQAGSITATFSAQGSAGTLSGQQAGYLSWYGAGSAQNMTSPATTGSGSMSTTLTASNLYPFYYSGSSSYAGNYQLWAGKCQQMRPPTGIDSATVNPGSAQSLTVQEPALDVFVTWNGTRVAPSDVKLSYTSKSGTSCTDSWYPAISAAAATATDGSLASPGQPFATSATSGSTASASGLTSQYTVCADYKSGSRYYQATSTPVYNNSFTAPTSVNLAITSSSTRASC